MTDDAANLAEVLAQRVAERDQPPPPPPLSQEPAAVQARVEAWLHTRHGVRDPRGKLRLGRVLLALMRRPECTTAELGRAAGLPDRGACRLVARLAALGLSTGEYRGLSRYHRLSRAAEDALLRVVAGPLA